MIDISFSLSMSEITILQAKEYMNTIFILNSIGAAMAMVAMQTYHSYKIAKHDFLFRSTKKKNVYKDFTSDIRYRNTFIKFTANTLFLFLISTFIGLSYILISPSDTATRVLLSMYLCTALAFATIFGSFVRNFILMPLNRSSARRKFRQSLSS